jgi:hypothetical protein
MNRLELESLVASAYPDNNSGLVTPAILRSTTDDIINNSVLPEDLVAGTNVTIDKSSLPSVTINATGGGSTPTLAVVLASGNDAGGQSMIGIGSITANQLNVDALDVVYASSLDNGNITTNGAGVLTATGLVAKNLSVTNLLVTTTSLVPALEVIGSYTSLDGGAITTSGSGVLTAIGLVATPTNTASLSPVEGQICVDNSVPGNSRLVIWLNGIWNTVSITAG